MYSWNDGRIRNYSHMNSTIHMVQLGELSSGL